MVSHSLAKKMIDWVQEGRRTPEDAVTYLARFCSRGVFNPSRAKRVLEDARHSMKYTRLPVFDRVPQYFKLGDRFEVLRAAGGALGGDQVYQR